MRSQVDATYTDFAKAFDKVSHRALLAKLNWKKSYLHHRLYRVNINGKFSDSYLATYGIPKGSAMEPMLLIIGESETLQIVVSYIPHNGSYKLYKVHLENITDIYNNLQDHQHICVLGDLSLIFNHPSFGLRIRSITLHCQATYINQTRFFSPMIFSVWA